MTVFAAGDASSSAGVPYTVTVPGVLELVRNSVTATAAASPTGPWALCWSPWKSRLVPRSASYSTMTPRFVARYRKGTPGPNLGVIETRPAGLDVEAVGGEIVGEDLHRALFLPAGLRVTRDVVGHGQELPVHQDR